MQNKRRASQVLWIECIGFAALLLVSWLDELMRLPQLILGGAAVSNWHEGAIESLAIITVWAFVFVATRRILKRFYYLEDQLQMCGWCRKLKRQGDWVSLEDYLTKELGVETSLGICTNCGRRVFPEEENEREGAARLDGRNAGNAEAGLSKAEQDSGANAGTQEHQPAASPHS